MDDHDTLLNERPAQVITIHKHKSVPVLSGAPVAQFNRTELFCAAG